MEGNNLTLNPALRTGLFYSVPSELKNSLRFGRLKIISPLSGLAEGNNLTLRSPPGAEKEEGNAGKAEDEADSSENIAESHGVLVASEVGAQRIDLYCDGVFDEDPELGFVEGGDMTAPWGRSDESRLQRPVCRVCRRLR